jgi:guanylate kinase
MYPLNLFNVAISEQQLIQYFELCHNCYLYNRLDIETLNQQNKKSQSVETKKFNKYVPFKYFFPLTEYYKNLISQQNYLENISKTDLIYSEKYI